MNSFMKRVFGGKIAGNAYHEIDSSPQDPNQGYMPCIALEVLLAPLSKALDN